MNEMWADWPAWKARFAEEKEPPEGPFSEMEFCFLLGMMRPEKELNDEQRKLYTLLLLKLTRMQFPSSLRFMMAKDDEGKVMIGEV